MTNQPNQPKMDQSKGGASRSDQKNPNEPQKTFGQTGSQDRSQSDRSQQERSQADLKSGQANQPKRSA